MDARLELHVRDEVWEVKLASVKPDHIYRKRRALKAKHLKRNDEDYTIYLIIESKANTTNHETKTIPPVGRPRL